MVQYKRSEPTAPPKDRTWLDPHTYANLDTLLTRVGRGDQGALKALYDETAPSVFGMLNHLLNDRGRAERLMTQIFVQVWRTAPRYDPIRDTPPSWLLVLIHQQITSATAIRPSS